MAYGYFGKIAHINLTTSNVEIETPSDEFYRKYAGGSGFGMYYLLKNTPSGADPYGPENCLSFFTSPITGGPVGGMSRLNVTAKSPQSGMVGDSQSGGFFPVALKKTGYDGIVITGKSDKPVYLRIENEKIEIKPADDLMGKTTGDVEEILKGIYGNKTHILQTGIAGENLVRYAAIMSMANRANGRTGMGAVMGSKNLKALVVSGNQKPEFFDKDVLKDLAKWGAKVLPDTDMAGLGDLGTPGLVSEQNEVGGLPSYNWSSGSFKDWKNLDGQTMKDTILKERDTCFGCPVRCKRVVEFEDENYKVDEIYGGIEYESISTLGTICGINDLKALSYANQLCNAYGVDTISIGATIGWAMDCFEQGIISLDDTDGMDLRFGHTELMIELIEKIVKRKGFGDLLAEGSARAAEKFGKEAEKLVVAVKKVELPAHMPQIKPGLGVIYSVNPFGPDHQSCEHDAGYAGFPERAEMLGMNNPQMPDVLNDEKVRYMYASQLFYSAMDCFSVCNFVFGPAYQLYGPDHLITLIKGATGWDMPIDEIQLIGERRLNMMRAFNAREGFGKDQDKLPEKIFKPLMGGASDQLCLDRDLFEKAKVEYYNAAGWNPETGNPDSGKLDSLGLSWIN